MIDFVSFDRFRFYDPCPAGRFSRTWPDAHYILRFPRSACRAGPRGPCLPKLPDRPLISKEFSGLEDDAAGYPRQIGGDPYQFKTREQGFHSPSLPLPDFQQGVAGRFT